MASSETCFPTLRESLNHRLAKLLGHLNVLAPDLDPHGASFRRLETFDATPHPCPGKGSGQRRLLGTRLKTFLTGGSAGTFGTID